MDVLVFSPLPSHPNVYGNTKRIFNLTGYLKKLGHVVHFVYYGEDGMRYADLKAMQNSWDTFTFMPKPEALYAPKAGNYDFDAWYCDDIASHVERIIELFDIDVLWMNYIWQSKLLETVPSHVLKVIDTHDRFTDRYKLLAAHGDTTYNWFSCSKEDEARYLDRADVVVAIQEEEADYFETLTKTPVVTVGHIEQHRFVEKKVHGLRRIGFVGGRSYINEKSIKAFLEAFDACSKLKEKVKIRVAGTVCSALDEPYPFLECLGLVEDLDAFYAGVDLVINPLLFGTGLKIKSIEALSYGLPVLSTPVGFEGIKSESRFHAVPDMRAMVAMIDELVTSPDRLERLRQICREVFDAYLDDTYASMESVLSLQKPRTDRNVDDDVLALYRELQAERLKSLETKQHEYGKLTEKIAALCSLNVVKHPLRKLKAYKAMLETYHFFRRQKRSTDS